jgi:hypothetical protein
VNPEGDAPRRGRELLLAGLFFLLVTVLMTWPQAARLGSAIADPWDGKLNLRILHWDWYQTFHDPLRLFQLPIFHPAKDALAFSEHLYGAALFGFPLLSAGATPLANYNVLLLLGMFLSGVSAWALARHVTGDPLASVAAGLVYAFVPWRLEQLSHLQFQWGPFLCLLLLFLLRYLERGRPRDLAAFAFFFAWNLLTNIHYGIFAGLLVLVVAAVASAWLPPRRAAASLAATAVATAACAPFLIPYVRVSREYGAQRWFSEVVVFSGRWTDFLSAGERNRSWGPLLKRWDAAEGSFFPGVLAVALAAVALWRLRAPRAERPGSAFVSPGRRRAVRLFDVALGAAVLIALIVWRFGGLSVGPLRIRDAGRVWVIATALALARLCLAFPSRFSWTSLPDWVRRRFRDPRAALFGAVGLCGIVIALGAHTPYYTFLYQSFGFVFRAIRAPARGIVLLQIALAVLAAWGLSLLTRTLLRARRGTAVAAILALMLLEYRAAPLRLADLDAPPPSVYRWLASADLPGGIVEWPLGLEYDFDYLFRQTAHERPLVNGYSGFFPPAYLRLAALVNEPSIPDSVWPAMRGLDGSVLVFHLHERRGFRVVRFADAVERALARGGLEPLRSFPHAGGRDFVFAAAGSPLRSRLLAGAPQAPDTIRAAFQQDLAAFRVEIARRSPPFGVIHLPAEGQHVAPGFWVHGWALDDAGVAEIRVSTELGPAGAAMLGGKWPGLAEAYPAYPEVSRGGWAFALPALPPGPHRLRLTVVSRDGGSTVLERGIVVDAPGGTPQ